MENITKICSKCGRELPISEFSKNKRAKDGLQCCCKQCNKQHNKQYYDGNKEEIAKYKKQYYDGNKEEIAKYKKQYYDGNKEEIAERMKQYYDTLRGYCIRIRNNNISEDRKNERIGEELPSNYPSIEDYMELLLLPDYYDGKQYEFTEMGLDRIYNDKPHTLDNVVPCSTKNNVKRHLMPFEEFVALFR